VAGIFACYLASQAVELYQLVSTWSAKENYVHDVYNVCRLFLWVLGVYWAYTTFCSAYALLTHDPRGQNRPPQQQQQKPQQHPNNPGNQNQNRLPQQLPIK
jgi:hypothetical protein